MPFARFTALLGFILGCGSVFAQELPGPRFSPVRRGPSG